MIVTYFFASAAGPADAVSNPFGFRPLLAVVLFLLLAIVIFAGFARRFRLPYPIMLVIAGLAISFVPHVPRIPLNPDLIFVIILPPLIYSSAWNTDWRAFRFNLVSICMLAIGLVAFTVIGVALIADRFITTLDWKSGFILGAVVATTDALAASSIAKSLGLPQRIVDILEGEALVNDATGLLALEFGLALLLRDQTPTVTTGILRFLWLIAGGLGVGLLVGRLAAWIESLLDDGPIEMVLSLIIPYVAYLGADRIRASGVLAVVACGLFLSRRSVQFFSPSVRLEITSAWKALDFILNGLVFILIGLQLPYVLAGIQNYTRATLFRYGMLFSLILILLRLIWMYPGAYLAWKIRRHLLHQEVPRPDGRQIFIVGWTGMRGVLALAAAISLPETLGNGQPFAQRNLIVFLTFALILVTLVGQGLTLPFVIRGLGLSNAESNRDEERIVRRKVLKSALDHLHQVRSQLSATADPHHIDDLIHLYEHRLEAVHPRNTHANPAPSDARAALVRETTGIERQTLLALRDRGEIGDELLRKFQRELDLTQTRFSSTV